MTPGREGSGPLRLLYLINGLGPGGAERSLAELLPFYIRARIDPLIVCLRHRDQGVESRIRSLGCDVRFLRSAGFWGRIRELRAILDSDHADLVHTTIFESDVIGRFAAARSGIPVLTSLVNTSYEPVRLEDPNVSRLGLGATRAVDGWTARHLTTWFHAITNAVKESAVRRMRIPAERVTVVHRGRCRRRLGQPHPERRREARRSLGLSDEAAVIVNVGRQEYQKGQKYLLEAASILGETRPDLNVLICGRSGHATGELRQLHEHLRLGEKVRFLGDRSDVADILAAADLFVFPSIYEGLGGALIEAMALGLPVVAADLPAIREVVEVGRNALLVPPKRPDSLAAAMNTVLDDQTLASSFRCRSEEIFRERFTIERSARGMIDLYHDLVGSTTSRSARSPTMANP